MQLQKRNSIEYEGWIAEKLEFEDYSEIGGFDCGDDDLNEFFQGDALEHKKQLLAETYSLKKATNGEESPSVAFISFHNDAPIKRRLSREKTSPRRVLNFFLRNLADLVCCSF